MAIRVPCPRCQTAFPCADDSADMKVRCPKCHHVFVASHSAASELAEAVSVRPTPADVPPPDILAAGTRSPRTPVVRKSGMAPLFIVAAVVAGVVLLGCVALLVALFVPQVKPRPMVNAPIVTEIQPE